MKNFARPTPRTQPSVTPAPHSLARLTEPGSTAWRSPPPPATAAPLTDPPVIGCSPASSKEHVHFLTAENTYDTHIKAFKDGRENLRPAAGKPYSTISWDAIIKLASSPVNRSKIDSPLIVPSTYNGYDGRTHRVQRDRGQFRALAVDVDHGDLTLRQVCDAVNAVTGGSEAVVYSSSSATADNKKWRVLILLTTSLLGKDYPDTQKALFSLLKQQGLTCDETLQRPGQPVYLPNVPPENRVHDGDALGTPLFYEWEHIVGEPLQLGPDHLICETREAIRKAGRRQNTPNRTVPNARQTAEPNIDMFDRKLISEFNKYHPVENLLETYGFVQDPAKRGHWRSPYSTSGTFSVQVENNHWVTVSGWAYRHDIGSVSRLGNRHGTGFDLYVHFEHGDDRQAAIEACKLKFPQQSSGPADLNDDTTLTDTGLARRLAVKGVGVLAYQRDQRRWMAYNGKHWEADNGITAEKVGKTISDELFQELAKVEPVERRTSRTLISFLKSAASQKTINAAVRLARSERQLNCTSEAFDSNPYVLNLANGTLDLTTGRLLPHNPADKITHLANVAFDRAAECPEWHQFVSSVMGGDEALVGFLQRSAGLLLSGDVSEQHLWIHYGDGANGKSTFLKTLEVLLGTYAQPASPDMLVHKYNRSRESENQFAVLDGRRFVTAIELDDGVRLSEAAVKQLTGGDTVTARRLYHESFTMQPTWKIHMAVNHKPVVRGNDCGIWRRVMAIPWGQEFTGSRADKTLSKKLCEELSGILNWCLAGFRWWRAAGLQPPEKVTLATRAYREENDCIRQWLDEECSIHPSYVNESLVLYRHYATWCESRNECPLSIKMFGQQLDRLGFRSERPTAGKHRKKTVRLGVRLSRLGGHLENTDEALCANDR